MAVQLEKIVPWGRLREEYELMFNLKPQDFANGVLDCGGGPSSFSAELQADGIRAIAVDPIYTLRGAEIQQRFESVAEIMLAQVRATPDDWAWSFHRDPDDLLQNRQVALKKFLGDYETGLCNRRYVAGELPALPFDSGSFGLAVCSHLLFLYSDLLSADFHISSVRELCRVAKEVRIFPLLTLQQKLSPHLDAVQSAIRAQGWEAEIVQANYEFQRGGNQMLRCF